MSLQEIDDDLDTRHFWSSVLSFSNDEVVQKKRFIMRMANALHGAGNFSFRTEQAIEKVAHAFGLRALLVLNPVSAILTFQSIEEGVVSTENYNFRVAAGLSASKLAALDMLCHDITEHDISFSAAESVLYDIETSAPVHPWWVTALAYGTAAATVTTACFGGSWYDGCCSFVFGQVTYVVSVFCQLFVGMAEVECFISAFLVSFLSTILDGGRSCLFGQIFGSLGWLLPGLTIMIAMLEVYSQMIIIGSSRLISGMLSAMQLGFGMQLGYMVVSRDHYTPATFKTGCVDHVDDMYKFILIPILATSFAVLIDADWKQVPGTIFTCGCGFTCSFFSARLIDPQIAPFLSAIVATFAARLFAHVNNKERPLVYIIVGMFMLVPGGVGVKGMTNMWGGDMLAGMTFTFQMLLVGVCLAIGVFLALLPRKNCLRRKKSPETPPVLYAESDSPADVLLTKGVEINNYAAVNMAV